jgi:hypothetical protein
MRCSSTVEGNSEISKYYTVATNEFANTNFWELSKHKKLQWLVCCLISPKIGKQRHYWLGASKQNGSKLKNALLDLLPDKKTKDIDLILQLNSEEEILEWMKQLGLSDQELKVLNQNISKKKSQ